MLCVLHLQGWIWSRRPERRGGQMEEQERARVLVDRLSQAHSMG